MSVRLLFLNLLLLVVTCVPVGAETIRFGIASMLSPGETLSHYERLNDYIADQLSMPLAMVHESNYANMNRQLEDQKVHFASICSGALLDLDAKSYHFLAIPVVRGKATYQSFIIANRNSGIQTLKDIDESKIFALTDPLSNTGALYPQYLFAKLGKHLEKVVRKVYFSGSHDNSIYLVNRGVVDVAAVDNLIYMHIAEDNPTQVKQIRIIHESPDFPIPPMVASAKLPQALYRQLQQVLTQMHTDPRGTKILQQLKIDRFIKPDNINYSIIEEMKHFINENTIAPTAKNTSK